MTDKRAKIARAIAVANGDDYEAVPRNKAHWVDKQGEFEGRQRDVNMPFQIDYDEMSKAAIEAMYRPTEFMMEMGLETYGHNPDMPDEEVEQIWQVMVGAALEGK